MSNASGHPFVAPRTSDKPQGASLRIYLRLLGYAWKYKTRFLVSLVFAVIIAASFGTMLVSMGSVVNMTFYEPVYDENGGLTNPDPALDIAQRIAGFTASMEDRTGRAPRDLDQRFLALVQKLRADKLRALLVLCVVILALSLIICCARFLQEYFAGTIGAGITTDLAGAMYTNLMRQSVGFFEARSSGQVIARFTNDVFMVNRGLSGVFVRVMREPFKAAIFLAVAFSVDVWLTLVGICVLPPIFYVLVRVGQKMRRSIRRSLQKIASLATVVNETVTGITIVKGYNMEAYEVGRVNGEIHRLRRILFQVVRLNAITGPLTEFLLVLGIAAFVMLSGQRVVSGQLQVGALLQLFVALGMLLDPVRKLSSVNNLVQTSVASAERVFEFIDAEPDILERPDAVAVPPLREKLSFEQVRFSYNGKDEVLRGVDFQIKRGEMVALVGFSGAGKSTIAKLIPRFYDVTEGAIKVDGMDIRQATFASLRDQISIVTQDTILFAESIRDNISFGRDTYTDDRVRAAAQAAHATNFIEKFPQAYDTVLGESGGTLSGGERQRLAIARAIIKDPSILILDEATSSLDSESERHIQEALGTFVEGRTSLVIAHRLSTVQRADRILVIDDGRVAEEGTHQELLDHGGIYRRLYETQFGPQEKNEG